MELWVRDGGKVVKYQGSLKKVFEELLSSSSGSPEILAFNGTKRERRRFKRELRKAGKNVLKAADNYLKWYKSCKRLFN